MSPVLIFPLLLSSRGPIQTPRIGIRVFKTEQVMEVWGADRDSGPFRLLATYPIAAMSGGLGPKRLEGDMQAPEGFYFINRFNPQSQFHLSLGINYPNSSDRKLGSTGHWGKDIFIHGNHVSAGCLAMTDPVIDVIYRLASHARDDGQRAIPVSIFPCRLTSANWNALNRQYANRPDLVRFWSTLRPAYTSFEQSHLWPRPHVDSGGYYCWPERRRAG
jgi:murein L,D-transpeptidase YafK